MGFDDNIELESYIWVIFVPHKLLLHSYLYTVNLKELLTFKGTIFIHFNHFLKCTKGHALEQAPYYFHFSKVILIIHLQLIIMPWERTNYTLALADKSWEILLHRLMYSSSALQKRL